MKKTIEAKESPSDEKPPFELDDSIISGVIKGKSVTQPDLTVTPFQNPIGKVSYRITGDVEKALKEIYENCPLGALDVIQGIKFTRSAIFALRGGKR